MRNTYLKEHCNFLSSTILQFSLLMLRYAISLLVFLWSSSSGSSFLPIYLTPVFWHLLHLYLLFTSHGISSVFIFYKSSWQFWSLAHHIFCKYWLYMLNLFNMTFPFIITSYRKLLALVWKEDSCPREWIPIQLRNMEPSYVCPIWQIITI